MLLKEDFRVNMDALRPNVEIIIVAGQKLMDNESLKSFLRYVLHAGNFINSVSICLYQGSYKNYVYLNLLAFYSLTAMKISH